MQVQLRKSDLGLLSHDQYFHIASMIHKNRQLTAGFFLSGHSLLQLMVQFCVVRSLAVISLPLPVADSSIFQGERRGTGIVYVISGCPAIKGRIEGRAGPAVIAGLVKTGIARDIGCFLAVIHEVFVVPAFKNTVRHAPLGNDLGFGHAYEPVENLLIGCRRVGYTS